MREIVFTHSGNLGDILFSLHFTIGQSVRLPGFLFR